MVALSRRRGYASLATIRKRKKFKFPQLKKTNGHGHGEDRVFYEMTRKSHGKRVTDTKSGKEKVVRYLDPQTRFSVLSSRKLNSLVPLIALGKRTIYTQENRPLGSNRIVHRALRSKAYRRLGWQRWMKQAERQPWFGSRFASIEELEKALPKKVAYFTMKDEIELHELHSIQGLLLSLRKKKDPKQKSVEARLKKIQHAYHATSAELANLIKCQKVVHDRHEFEKHLKFSIDSNDRASVALGSVRQGRGTNMADFIREKKLVMKNLRTELDLRLDLLKTDLEIEEKFHFVVGNRSLHEKRMAIVELEDEIKDFEAKNIRWLEE